MKILITGASGFIGKTLLDRLSNDHEVSCIIRDKTKNYRHVEEKSTSVYYGTIDDLEFVKRVISESEPDVVFHLASSAIVRMCARNPVGAYQNNVMGTVKLLDAIRTSGDTVKKVIVSTSDKVYGHATPPYDEDTPFMPKYTYEATKSCQDFVCQNYFHNYEVPVVIARMGNIYGPGDPNDSRLIPRTILNAANDIPPMIYSDVADFQRDFIYVDDAADALITLMDNGKVGEAYCVGSGTEDQPKIKDIVKMILEVMDKNGLTIEYPDRHVSFREIEKQSIKADKITQIGWKKKTNLREGLKKTVSYYSKGIT